MATIWHPLETAPLGKSIKLLTKTESGGFAEERGRQDEVEGGFYVWRDSPFPLEVHPVAWRPAPNKLRIILACIGAAFIVAAALFFVIE